MIRFGLIIGLFLLWVIPPAAAQGTCTVQPAGGRVNMRGGPGTQYAIADKLLPGQPEVVTGQIVGDDGFVWWRVVSGGWVRSDVSTTNGDCSAIPTVNAPPDYCGGRTVLAERPILTGVELIYLTERFRVHYTLGGDDATTEEFVREVGAAMERSWVVQIDQMGWGEPPPDCGEGGDERFDVYLLNLDTREPGILGYAQPEEIIGDNPNTPEREQYAAYSHLVLDNNYDFSAEPLRVMRSTAAHEFHHNVQLSYDVGDQFGGLDEAGATWMETQVFPTEETATGYVTDLFYYPDVCLGSFEERDGSRVYAEYLMIDSLVQDFGAESLHTLWRFRADEEGLQSFYSGLAALGTTPDEVVQRMAIRNLIRNYATASEFPGQVFIEARIEGLGEISPRRDGVQELSVDYVAVTVPGSYDLAINDHNLHLYGVGISGTTAQVFDLGTQGTFDTTPFEYAYVIILNQRVHYSHGYCNTTNWLLTVKAGQIPVAAMPETWDATHFIVPAQHAGTQAYPGSMDSGDDFVMFTLYDLQPGDTVYAFAEATSGNLDPYLSLDHALYSDLYDPAGYYLIEDDDSGGGLNAQFEYVIDTPGDYAVVLVPYDGTGGYLVQIAINEPIDNPEAASISRETVSRAEGVHEFIGTLINDDDALTVDLPALQVGDVVYAYAEATSGDLDPYLGFDYDTRSALYDPNAPFLAQDDDGGGSLNALIQFEVQAAADYTLFLTKIRQTSGEYRLLIGINTPEVLSKAGK